MKKVILKCLAIATILFISCEDDDQNTVTNPEFVEVNAPATYTFERNGESTVSFSGQTTRIQMAEELVDAMLDFESTTESSLLNMFSNENNPFSSASLNDSDKNLKSKVASSVDYFSQNTATASEIRVFFESQLSGQINEVFPNQMMAATSGVAGQIADGESTRYVNAKGLEYDQITTLGLIGALMTDQMLNNYLSPAVLDFGTNIEDNDTGVLVDGKPYTDMEHKWDEAFGYVYGASPDVANANSTIGLDDSFMNKYIGRVEGDSDFEGIAQEIFDAFKLGRAAITEGNYELRDAQAALLREKLSEVIGIRAVYYLEQGKNALVAEQLGTAFHDISEGYGFIYSLQFTQNPDTNAPYFSRSEVAQFLEQLEEGNGLWDISPETLEAMSVDIASRFDFTVEQAGSIN